MEAKSAAAMAWRSPADGVKCRLVVHKANDDGMYAADERLTSNKLFLMLCSSFSFSLSFVCLIR